MYILLKKYVFKDLFFALNIFISLSFSFITVCLKDNVNLAHGSGMGDKQRVKTLQEFLKKSEGASITVSPLRLVLQPTFYT